MSVSLFLWLTPGLTRADGLSQRIESLVREAAGETALERDTGRLDEVATWAAREAFAGRQDRAALRDRLWTAGLRDFEFRPLTVVARGVDPAVALAAALEDPKIRWGRYTHFALSVVRGGERTAVSVVLTRRGATVAAPEQGLLAIKLLDGLKRPSLFVTRPDGSVERFEAAEADGGWRVDWDPGSRPGELFLEIVAEGDRGPEVVALWREPVAEARRPDTELPDANDPFPGGGAPAHDPYADRPTTGEQGSWITGLGDGPDRPPTSADAKAAEDHLWRLIQNARVARKLPRLERDPAMTKAARQHAGELVRGEPFGHHTSSGNALDRLTAHGFAASRATENVAVAAHVVEAHAALMASPAHRANLLDAGVDHAGVGVVLQRDARGRWSATASEVFARALPEGGAERWTDLALNSINAVRASNGLSPVRDRDRLSDLAVEFAQGIVDSGVLGFPRDDRDRLLERVRFHFNAVGRISVDVIVTAQPDRAGQLAHSLEDVFDEVGIGIVELPAPLGGHSAGTPLILIVWAER